MALSAFDLYSIGIGPSSSHTVGPMRAAKRFVDGLYYDGDLAAVTRVKAELFGSLGATGHGHGSEKAVILGLEGESPATVDTDTAESRVSTAQTDRVLLLAGCHDVTFDRDADLVMHRRESLPGHPNGMVFTAYDGRGVIVRQRTYYSVGGGFVVDEAAIGLDRVVQDATPVRHPFSSADELLRICRREGLRINDVMLANELAWRDEDTVRSGLLGLWDVMTACVEAGCHRSGVLPGGLKVPRRAPALFDQLTQITGADDPLAPQGIMTRPSRTRRARRAPTSRCRRT